MPNKLNIKRVGVYHELIMGNLKSIEKFKWRNLELGGKRWIKRG